MFRHVVLWRFDDDSDDARNRELAIHVKAGLEEMAYEVHGLRTIDVHIDPARNGSSNADVFLDAVFEDRDVYRDFLESPRYIAIKKILDSCMEERMCMDFEEEPEDDALLDK